MSVLAVLTIQFARTIAMALTISEFIQKFVNRFLLPIVKAVVPKEYQVSVLIFESTETTYASTIIVLFVTTYFMTIPEMVPCIVGLAV